MARLIRLSSIAIVSMYTFWITGSKSSVSRADGHFEIFEEESLDPELRNLSAMQNAIGILQAIGILRTKLSLFQEMLSAQEAAPDSTDVQINDAIPPGPLLAYSDCRLGILPLHVCTHLGFKREGTIVPPSSLQSKMLILPEARALVRATQAGMSTLKRDKGLKDLLGTELLNLASDALLAFKEAQLLVPSFRAASVPHPALQNARKTADAFLHAVTHEHKFLRLPKVDESGQQLKPEELAQIFANLPRY